MVSQPSPPTDRPETAPLVAWPSAKHADRMVALVPPDHPLPLPKVGDRLVLSTTTNPADAQQYVEGLIVEPAFKIRYGPNKGKQAVIVQTTAPAPAEGRAAFVAHELLAAACHYYCAISHLAFKFWQPSLFPQDHQDLILREADQAFQRRTLALTRRQDYITDTPHQDIPASFWQTDNVDTLLLHQSTHLLSVFWREVPDWATRWCDNICCNPAGNPTLGENPWHRQPVPEPKNIPDYTTGERLLLNLTGAEAHLYQKTHDLHQHLLRQPPAHRTYYHQPVIPFINAHEYRTATYKKLEDHANSHPSGDLALTDDPEMKETHYTIVSHLWEQTGHLKQELQTIIRPLATENRPAT